MNRVTGTSTAAFLANGGSGGDVAERPEEAGGTLMGEGKLPATSALAAEGKPEENRFPKVAQHCPKKEGLNSKRLNGISENARRVARNL